MACLFTPVFTGLLNTIIILIRPTSVWPYPSYSIFISYLLYKHIGYSLNRLQNVHVRQRRCQVVCFEKISKLFQKNQSVYSSKFVYYSNLLWHIIYMTIIKRLLVFNRAKKLCLTERLTISQNDFILRNLFRVLILNFWHITNFIKILKIKFKKIYGFAINIHSTHSYIKYISQHTC